MKPVAVIRWTVTIAAPCVIVFAANASVADPVIVFNRIVDSNTPHPNGTGTLSGFSNQVGDAPILHNRYVAFRAFGGNGAPDQGIYVARESVRVVADTSMRMPGWEGDQAFFQGVGMFWLDGQNVALFGGGGPPYCSSNCSGIFADFGSGLVSLTRPNFGDYKMYQNVPCYQSDYRMAVVGEGPIRNPTLYRYSNCSFTPFLLRGDQVPGSNETFCYFGIPVLDDGDIAFSYTTCQQGEGIYTKVGGAVNIVADMNTPIPNGSGTFDGFYGCSFRNGKVAFTAHIASNTLGVYTNSSGLRVVADANTPIPGSTGSFVDFGIAPSIDNGDIALSAQRSVGFANRKGIYVEIDGVLIKVFDTDDIVDGHQPTDLSIGTNALDGKQLAIMANYAPAEPYKAIYVATVCQPPPILGDVNSNGVADLDDIPAFVGVLLNPLATSAGPLCAANVNQDQHVDAGDIQPLIGLLLNR